jgi:hypothetical protein
MRTFDWFRQDFGLTAYDLAAYTATQRYTLVSLSGSQSMEVKGRAVVIDASMMERQNT